jgi:predicted RNase H-like HicB family nuclease
MERVDHLDSAYAVVIRKVARNYSADCPDVPGCVATGRTIDETLHRMEQALVMHFEDLRAEGRLPPPAATPISRVVRGDGAAELYTVVRVPA